MTYKPPNFGGWMRSIGGLTNKLERSVFGVIGEF